MDHPRLYTFTNRQDHHARPDFSSTISRGQLGCPPQREHQPAHLPAKHILQHVCRGSPFNLEYGYRRETPYITHCLVFLRNSIQLLHAKYKTKPRTKSQASLTPSSWKQMENLWTLFLFSPSLSTYISPGHSRWPWYGPRPSWEAQPPLFPSSSAP